MQELKNSIYDVLEEIKARPQLEIIYGLMILMRDQLKVNSEDAAVQVEEDTVLKESIMTQTELENPIFKVPAIPEMVMETELVALDLSCKASYAPLV